LSVTEEAPSKSLARDGSRLEEKYKATYVALRGAEAGDAMVVVVVVMVVSMANLSISLIILGHALRH